MRKDWHDRAWRDYLYWQSQDKKTLRRVNALIKAIERGDIELIGKPEHLKGELSGWSAVRIDKANRLIYKLEGETVQIMSCKGHYSN
jgi:toxin YoeB